MAEKPVIEQIREKFRAIIAREGFYDEPVRVTVGTLTTSQAIGNPSRKDFPLLEGREVMVQAEFRGSCGQAFTDRPHEFSGSLRDIVEMDLTASDSRAVFIAAVNAITAYLGMVTGVRHCRNEEPEECGAQIAQYILEKFGKAKVGLVGLQPAILDNLVKVFGAENVRCTDLNPKNIGAVKYGARILDGKTDTVALIEWCDLALVTSSTIVNGTFDAIQEEATARGKSLIIFGVTGAGSAQMLGLEKVCFKAS